MTSPEGTPVAVIVASYIGDLEEGEKVMAPLRQIRSSTGGYDRPDFIRCS